MVAREEEAEEAIAEGRATTEAADAGARIAVDAIAAIPQQFLRNNCERGIAKQTNKQ